MRAPTDIAQSRRAIVLGLVPTLLFAACSITSKPGETRRAEPVPEEVASRFDYVERGAPLGSWTVTLEARHDAFLIYKVRGEVTLVGDNTPAPVEVEYWRTLKGKDPAPAVVVTPILGGGNDIARLIAREYAEAGAHGVIVWRGVKVLTPAWAPEEVERALRRGIVARRRVVDWLESRPEVDSHRIGAFGVSLGGIATACLLAAEPRIKAGVVALAGGDLASVVMTSNEPRVTNYRDARLVLDKLSPEGLETRIRESLVSDPGKLARYVDPRRVLLFTAKWDETVPTRNQELLRKELGNPFTFELPSSHYSALLYVPFIRSRSTSWLLERLGHPSPARIETRDLTKK